MNRRFIWLSLILLGLLLIIVIPKYQAQSKGEIRAALDIGSGATNLKIAKVDPKTDKIISTIFEQTIPVAYQKHLEQSPSNTFDEDIMKQGIHAIKALKETADSYHAKKVIAVATAAFRKATNAQQFAQNIEKDTGVQVRIIDQDEEGILAFRGALAITPTQPDHAIVWDIGGGSMQLTTLTESGTYLVDKGKTASIPFKNAIIQTIQNKDLKTVQSPNPISFADMEGALQYAGQEAFSTNPYIKSKLQDPQVHVLAVGNLFNIGIRSMVNNEKVIKQDQLKQAVMSLAGKTDAELPGGSLVEVAVSNPLLVLGYMQALQINQIDTVSVNNADGALTYPPYWQ